MTAIYTGMRLGEIMALTWNDINFKTISINKSWNYLDGGGFKKNKTKSSIKTIRVNDDLLNLIVELKVNKQGLVFRNAYGQLLTSNAVNKTLRNAMSQCGIVKQDYHFHSLRHSHVAYLLANDVPLYIISKRLGHSNTTITADKYAYLIDEFKERSNEMIEDSLNELNPKSKNESEGKPSKNNRLA
ncbi:site-specific integrase [Limosilactobacillus coleohominis]|uniref:site-specific integrase n=1 Tax=Limosilactobacillus coleohominis TaxID=181675 RepID=UPI0026EB8510|nr:site-specific integrase [Limosilactobacillus coleohominis]